MLSTPVSIILEMHLIKPYFLKGIKSSLGHVTFTLVLFQLLNLRFRSTPLFHPTLTIAILYFLLPQPAASLTKVKLRVSLPPSLVPHNSSISFQNPYTCIQMPTQSGSRLFVKTRYSQLDNSPTQVSCVTFALCYMHTHLSTHGDRAFQATAHRLWSTSPVFLSSEESTSQWSFVRTYYTVSWLFLYPGLFLKFQHVDLWAT